MELTIKQEKFAQGLFVGLSQREAYKQAYAYDKMKDKTIDERACVLANDDKVKTRLEGLTNELKNRNMITVEKVLKEYAKICFSDIKDFLAYRTEKIKVDEDEEGNPIFGYRQIVDAKPSEEVDGALISEVSIGRDGTFKFKLHDKLNALEKVGKHLGMFIERKEVTGPNGGPIEINSMTEIDRLAFIKKVAVNGDEGD